MSVVLFKKWPFRPLLVTARLTWIFTACACARGTLTPRCPDPSAVTESAPSPTPAQESAGAEGLARCVPTALGFQGHRH